MPHRIVLVDVFAERPYSGNPLAMVVGEEALLRRHLALPSSSPP